MRRILVAVGILIGTVLIFVLQPGLKSDKSRSSPALGTHAPEKSPEQLLVDEESSDAQPNEEVSLEMESGSSRTKAPSLEGPLRVKTLDTEGKPIQTQIACIETDVEELDVLLLTPEQGLSQLSFHQSMTDADGGTTLPLERERFLVVARAAQHAPEYRWIDVRDQLPGQPIQLVLKRSAGLTGKVIDGTTLNSVSGAVVSVFPHVRPNQNDGLVEQLLDRVLVGQSAITNERGEFALDQLRDEFSVLRMHAEGYIDVRNTLFSIEGQHVIVRIGGGSRLAGRVVEKEGKPIAGTEIQLGRRGMLPADLDRVHSDQDGRFELSAVPEGYVSLVALAKGFAIRKFLFDDKVPEWIEIVLEPEKEFRGIVVDDRGQPVEGAEVHVGLPEQNAMLGRMTTETDGSWYMCWLPRSDRVSVETSKEGYSLTFLVGLSAPNKHVMIVLPRRGIVSGRLRDEDGGPITSFSVEEMPHMPQCRMERDVRRSNWWETIQSDAGSFVLRDRNSMLTDLRFEAPGFEPVIVRDVDVPPGGDAGPLEIVMRRGSTASGLVVDDGGDPVAGAVLGLMRRSFSGDWMAEKSTVRATADATGAFALAGLPEESFTLSVRASGFGTAMFADLRASDFPRRLEIQRAGALEGIVECRWPAPESVLKVLVYRSGTWPEEIAPDPQGRFLFPELSPGLYCVELIDQWTNMENYSDAKSCRWTEIRPGEKAFLSLQCNAGAVIRGTVRCEGAPLQGLVAQLVDLDNGRIVGRSEVNGMGVYVLPGLVPGEYVLRLTADESGVILDQERGVSLAAPDAVVEVDFEVKGVSVSGVVRNEEDQAVDAAVGFHAVNGGVLRCATRVDAKGRYRVLGLAESVYFVHVSAPGHCDEYQGPMSLGDGRAEQSLEHVLEEECRLEIETVDDLGQPVAGASVHLLVPPWPTGFRDVNLVSGREPVIVARLPECNADLSAALEGYEPAGPVDVALQKGDLCRKRLELVRLATLVVRVEENGRPKAGVPVELTGGREDLDTEQRSMVANSEGESLFQNLPSGRYAARLPTGESLTVDLSPGDRKTQVLAIQNTGAK